MFEYDSGKSCSWTARHFLDSCSAFDTEPLKSQAIANPFNAVINEKTHSYVKDKH